MPVTPLRVFSYGAGVQSTAVLALAAAEKVPHRTFLFANVGDDSEHPASLAYLREVAVPFAAEHDLVLHELPKLRRDGTVETLLGRLTREGSRSIPIPVRMGDNGAPGTRQCTDAFKRRVIARWLREHGATPAEPAHLGLGISVDEIERARPDSGIRYVTNDYPLLDLGFNRGDCEQVIRMAGLPVPPKSACWFCPFHRPSTWQRMRHEEPDLYEKSVALEALLNERRDMLGRDRVYLTRFGRPLDEVTSADEQLSFSLAADDGSDCESGYCMT